MSSENSKLNRETSIGIFSTAVGFSLLMAELGTHVFDKIGLDKGTADTALTITTSVMSLGMTAALHGVNRANKVE